MLEYTPIPEEQIREFDEKGYLIVRNVLEAILKPLSGSEPLE